MGLLLTSSAWFRKVLECRVMLFEAPVWSWRKKACSLVVSGAYADTLYDCRLCFVGYDNCS